MKTKNIGVKLNISDYIPKESNIKIHNSNNYTKRTHKIGEALAVGSHYLGIGIISGAFIGSIASGVEGSNNVKSNCDKIKDLYNEMQRVNEVYKKEYLAKQEIETSIDMVKDSINNDIGDLQKKIDKEEEDEKKRYKTTQIITSLTITFFILIVISKVIIARYT
jgi:hypothetical protein